MLVLPLRSHQQQRVRHDHDHDNAAASLVAPHKDLPSFDNSPAADLQKHGDGMMMMMMSTLPTTRARTPKRPKLSLQTSNIHTFPVGHKSRTALNLTVVTQSPTYGNTYANAFNYSSTVTDDSLCTPHAGRKSPQSSPDDRSSASLSSASATTSSSCHTSPFPVTAPYCLPLEPRSILRNSPLPRRFISAPSTKTLKPLFPPIKQVSFCERLEELIPTTLISEPPDSSETSDSDSDKRLKDEIAERKALDDLLEETATKPVHRRRRRRQRREWIRRPLADDIFSPRHCDLAAAEAVQALSSTNKPPTALQWKVNVPEASPDLYDDIPKPKDGEDLSMNS